MHSKYQTSVCFSIKIKLKLLWEFFFRAAATWLLYDCSDFLPWKIQSRDFPDKRAKIITRNSVFPFFSSLSQFSPSALLTFDVYVLEIVHRGLVSVFLWFKFFSKAQFKILHGLRPVLFPRNVIASVFISTECPLQLKLSILIEIHWF